MESMSFRSMTSVTLVAFSPVVARARARSTIRPLPQQREHEARFRRRGDRDRGRRIRDGGHHARHARRPITPAAFRCSSITSSAATRTRCTREPRRASRPISRTSTSAAIGRSRSRRCSTRTSSDVPAGMSPVVFVFDDASPEQFRYIEQNGTARRSIRRAASASGSTSRRRIRVGRTARRSAC